ncbi:MAG: hypothetical protein FJY95_20180 [Candidatus Handelsmanbacteria bacterium]|nr:hypothetical protein [Candidatus Handelsmanbacteria bacterium]
MLTQMQVLPAQVNLKRCLRIASNQVAGKAAPLPKRNVRLDQFAEAQTERVEYLPGNLRIFLKGPASEPTAAEVEQRNQQEQQCQEKLRNQQFYSIIQNLETYVAQKQLSPEEADRFSKVHQVDRAVKSGKISSDQGSKIRNSELSGNARYVVDRKLKAVTEYAVTYLQLFAALKRIETKDDAALRFPNTDKEIANSKKEQFGPASVANLLIKDFEQLKLLFGIMDRQDGEVRMMVAGLPPYKQVSRKGQDQRIERLIVEPGFIPQLRQRSCEEMANRLNATDKMVRVRATADMLCLIVLINRLVKPMPFCKEIRLLKIDMIIEEFYKSTEDLAASLGKAQKFLKSRLRVLYPDITSDEVQEIEEKSLKIIERVQRRVIAQRLEQARAGQGGQGRRGREGDQRPGKPRTQPQRDRPRRPGGAGQPEGRGQLAHGLPEGDARPRRSPAPPPGQARPAEQGLGAGDHRRRQMLRRREHVRHLGPALKAGCRG